MPNEDDQNHLLSEFAACGEKSRRKKAFRDSSLKVKGLNQGFLRIIFICFSPRNRRKLSSMTHHRLAIPVELHARRLGRQT